MKFDCSTGIFLKSTNLICRSMDISKCFRKSLRIRDNESTVLKKSSVLRRLLRGGGEGERGAGVWTTLQDYTRICFLDENR